jgi:predicted amidohydrolase YtcJ
VRHAETIFYNGKIFTMDQGLPACTAVAVQDGRIVALGGEEVVSGWQGDRTALVDLAGKMMLPGFHDSHLHFIGYGLTLQMVPLAGVDSIEEVKSRVSKAAETIPKGEWIVGTGWDHNLFREKRYLQRQDLDQAAPDHPVMLTRVCGHLQAVNSQGLAMAGISELTLDPPGGQIDRDEHGQPTGILRETATRLVMAAVPAPSYERLEKALELAVAKAHSCGLTSVTTDDIRADRVTVLADNLKLYHEMWAKGNAPIRITLEIRDLVIDEFLAAGYKTGTGDDRVKIGNLKVFQDGALGAKTAYLREPYQNDTGRGIPIHDQASLEERVIRGHNAGLQVAIHAIGDAAIDSCLDAFEKAQKGNPRPDPRHRIIHYCLVDEGILERSRRLGVVADIQTTFVPLNGQWADDLMGPERAKRTYPWKTILDAGIQCAGSSDCPITPLEPLLGIWAAVTRHGYYNNNSAIYYPEQCLTVQQAIELYTTGAAYADFDEEKKGAITVGKFADFVVLEEDLFIIDPDTIKDVQILMTVVDGKIVYAKAD